MVMMLSKTYEAFKAAGAPDNKAREASEEIARFESRLSSTDNRLSRIEAELSILKWMNGIVIAGVLSLVVKAFFT